MHHLDWAALQTHTVGTENADINVFASTFLGLNWQATNSASRAPAAHVALVCHLQRHFLFVLTISKSNG